MTGKRKLTKPKAKKPKPSTLTLRLTPDEVIVLDGLKQITGQKTGTGAIMQAIWEFEAMKKVIDERGETIKELRNELRNMESGIDLIKEGFELTGITGKKKKKVTTQDDDDDFNDDY